jgi:hypothetical protein
MRVMCEHQIRIYLYDLFKPGDLSEIFLSQKIWA